MDEADAPLDLSAARRPSVIKTAYPPSPHVSFFLTNFHTRGNRRSCRRRGLWKRTRRSVPCLPVHHQPRRPSVLLGALTKSDSAGTAPFGGSKLSSGANRMSYPREFKLMVIQYYHTNGTNKYRTCKEFGITKSMLNGWLSKMEKIRQSRPGSLKSGRSGRRPQFPDIERQLFAIYSAAVKAGEKVGNRWIRDKARALAVEQCSPAQLAGMCQFSERWLANFKKRYGIASSPASAASTISDELPSYPPDQLDSESAASPPPGESSGPSEVSTTSEASSARPLPFSPHWLDVLGRATMPSAVFPPTPNYEPGRRGRKVQFPQVEAALHRRVVAHQAAGGRLSNRWLQEEARSLAASLCPEAVADAARSARCSFSDHWLHNFKKRYGVSLKGSPSTTHSSSAPPSTASSASPPPAEEGESEAGAEEPGSSEMLAQWQQWLLHQAYLSSLAKPPPSLNLTEWYNKQLAPNEAKN